MRRTNQVLDADWEALLPVELVESQLRLDDDNDLETDLIISIRNSALQYCELATNLAFVSGEFSETLNADKCVFVLEAEIDTITSIHRANDAGELTLVDSSDYVAHIYNDYTKVILSNTGSEIDRCKVVFNTIARNVLPPTIKSVALLICGHLYENREAVVLGSAPNEIPLGVDSILSKHKLTYL